MRPLVEAVNGQILSISDAWSEILYRRVLRSFEEELQVKLASQMWEFWWAETKEKEIFASENIYCNSSQNDPNNTTMQLTMVQTYNGSSTQNDFIPRVSICFCNTFTENVPHRSLRKICTDIWELKCAVGIIHLAKRYPAKLSHALTALFDVTNAQP